MRPRDEAPAQASPDGGALDQADHDQLTGLWNRRRFEDEFDRRLADSRRTDERLALLSIDVDGYRDVIGRHGARAAEGLIRSIALVLAKRLRPNTTLARMGGDEFAAVIPRATPLLVQSVADEPLHGRARAVTRRRFQSGACHRQHRWGLPRPAHDAPRGAGRCRHRPLRGQGRRLRPGHRARALARRVGHRLSSIGDSGDPGERRGCAACQRHGKPGRLAQSRPSQLAARRYPIPRVTGRGHVEVAR